MSNPGDPPTHAALIEALRDPSAYPHAAERVELIETHISSVLLAGAFAYKLKKPVDLGFANFSTLALRKQYCDAEVRLNRRSAPSLYLDVVPVTRASRRGGRLRLGGTGPALDYAVRMRRFDADARLDHVARAGHLDGALVDKLAAGIAKFHAACEPVAVGSPYGTADTVQAWMRNTTNQLRERVERHPALAADRPRLARIVQWSEAEFARRAPVFAARQLCGFVRECHGDLHLANVALIEGAPVAFDCIEFNPALRFIDVMSDVAFTWMDLLDHDLPHQAARFLNGWLEATGDYAGLATLRYYAVYRALVRALVAAIRVDQERSEAADADAIARDAASAARYLAVAERILSAPAARLILVAGVTGTGKTTVAGHLLEEMGAVRVRSDVERKRRAGVAPQDHSAGAAGATVGQGLYDAASTHATYTHLADAAAAILDGNFNALVDATFQRHADRAAMRTLAARRGVRFDIVLCHARPAVLRARVQARLARGNDASDATPAVLDAQLASFEAPAADEAPFVHRLDTGAEPDVVARRCGVLAAMLHAPAP